MLPNLGGMLGGEVGTEAGTALLNHCYPGSEVIERLEQNPPDAIHIPGSTVFCSSVSVICLTVICHYLHYTPSGHSIQD